MKRTGGFNRAGNFDALERATQPEGAFFDLFNPRSQMKLFEFVAFGEGFLSDGFNRAGNFDALERATQPEGAFFDLFNPRSQMKLFESGAL